LAEGTVPVAEFWPASGVAGSPLVEADVAAIGG
jgi:hypothetical protein